MKFQATTLPLLALAISIPLAGFGQGLPLSTRDVFKCTVDGKVVYSDAPCLGAERLHIEPTRGMDKSTGTARHGRDVVMERIQESTRIGLQAVSGLTPEQLAKAGKRNRLSQTAQQECGRLDTSIASGEARETKASAVELPQLRRNLFGARVRYRELGC